MLANVSSARTPIAAKLGELDLQTLVSEPRPAPAALRSALEDIFGGPRVLIRPLASKDGFAVVQEDRGLSTNQYQTLLTARVKGDPPALTFDPWDSRASAVQGAYQSQLERVSAMQVSAVLVGVVEWLAGTAWLLPRRVERTRSQRESARAIPGDLCSVVHCSPISGTVGETQTIPFA